MYAAMYIVYIKFLLLQKVAALVNIFHYKTSPI